MPLAVLIILSTLIDNIVMLEKIKKFMLIFLIIDAVMAILQFFEFDFAWDIRSMLQSFSLDQDIRVMHAIKSHDHPIGLAYQSITFSYHMLLLFALSFSNLIEDKKNIWNQACFVISAIGLFISFSMSTIGGVVFSVIFLLLRKNKIPDFKLIIFYVLGCLILLLILLYKRDFNFVSAISRFFHLYAGFNVFLDNYIYGMQGIDYTKLSTPYLEKLNDVPNYVLYEAVHNSYMLAMLKLGFLVIVLIFFLFFLIAKLCKTVELGFSNGRYLYSIYFPAYFITSFFHNAGAYTGDQLFWIVVGLLITTVSFDKGNRNE